MSGGGELFPGFERRLIRTEAGEIFPHSGGQGPPLAKADLSPFPAEALDHYRRPFGAPERVDAVRKDYRAGAGIDRRLEADLSAGRKISGPTFLVWASGYLASDPLPIWRWCTALSGAAVAGGHFLAAENPTGSLGALIPFLRTLKGQ